MYSAAHGNSHQFFPTYIQKLDTLLQGGIPAGCITEVNNYWLKIYFIHLNSIQIAGPPAIGKTQLCLQMSVVAASYGGVMYIDTEGAFTAQR